jgi:myosin heavy subunit
MKSIRGSLGAAPKSNFFSFQDIIMSVTGILIVIALLLALQIDKVGESSADHEINTKNLVSNDIDPPSSSPEELSRLEEEIWAKKNVLQDIRGSSQSNESENQIEQEILKIEDQIARLSKPDHAAESTIPSSLKWEEIQKRLAEINRLREEIKSQEEMLSSLVPRVENGAKKLIEMEAEVKATEAAVVQLRLEKNKLQLIRELSDTTKEPVIVDVSQNKIVVMRFDNPEPSEMPSEASFKRYLKTCKAEDQYFVLYFRPSGASRFESLREMVKSAGFELGYDATEENTNLSLGKGDKP